MLLLVAFSGCLDNTDDDLGLDDVQGDAGETAEFVLEWADPGAATLRPGADMPICTFDWLFVDPVNGTYYVGIAGHCTDDIDQNITLVGEGEIGHVVFDSDNSTLQEDFGVEGRVDFSLIELWEGKNLIAHPQIIGFDGPTGYIDCDETAVGDRIAFYGYGMVFGEVEQTRPRHGVLASCDGKDYGAQTTAIFGDSGASVLHYDTGKALGIVSRLGIDAETPSELTGATMPYIFTELAKAGFGNVKLATMDGGLVGPQDDEPQDDDMGGSG